MSAVRARAALKPVIADLPAHDAPLSDLLRRILDRVEAGDWDEAPVPPGESGDVLLALALDHSRYMLVRHEVQPGVRVALSPREREIARLIARGLPNKAIAAVLDISLWTVATYVRRLFAKLGVGSRAEMVASLMKDGLLEPER